jgi:hypothetical protein
MEEYSRSTRHKAFEAVEPVQLDSEPRLQLLGNDDLHGSGGVVLHHRLSCAAGGPTPVGT